MFIQATLPLLSLPKSALCRPAPVAGPGRSDPEIEAVRSTLEAEYLELRTRRVLEQARRSRTGGWTLDPYRGCEWEDPFEAQRFNRNSLQRPHRQGSRTRIFVKSWAAATLRRQLAGERFRGRSIALGVGTDPYQPAEKHFLVTRSILEVLLEFKGLSLSIETRSPLIARDLDLLAELDRRHAVEIIIGLAAIHPELDHRLEPLVAPPQSRLRTVEKLTQEGLSTRIRCEPLLPGINSSEETLGPLFAAARRAGARDVTGRLFTMPPAVRTWFFPWLEREFPELVGRYRQLFGWRDHLSPGQREVALAPFQRFRLLAGFPRPFAGRG